MTYIPSHRHMAQRQLGFTMIELMVALLIGLFLMGGLMTLLQNNRKAFSSQSALAQLQDSERLAMSMMTGVIQQAGYFTDPTINSPSTALPAAAAFASGAGPAGLAFAAGQGLTGATVAGSDVISARYTTGSGDGILNCSGRFNPATSGANATYTNQFGVAQNAQNVWQLGCLREDGTFYPLVNNVTNMVVLYGVNTSGAGNNVDTYMTAAQVTAATAWNNVISASVQLTFTNPLYVAANPQGQLPTITVQRYIAIMRQT
jgi:type IV pilus assembly protein PilW